MAYSTGLIIGIYLLLLGLFLFIWYIFAQVRGKYWEFRSIEPSSKLIVDTENFERRKKFFEPRPGGKTKFKPKWKSDAALYDLEQNPEKR
jgi:hypothetical protein